MLATACHHNDTASQERGPLRLSFEITDDEYMRATTLLNNVGTVYHQSGESSAAMESYKDALEMRMATEMNERDGKIGEDCIFKMHEARLFLLRNRRNAKAPTRPDDCAPVEDFILKSSHLIGMRYYSTPVQIDDSVLSMWSGKEIDASILFNISLLQLQQDNVNSAVNFLKLALETFNPCDGIDTPNAALKLMVLTNLGFALYRQGCFKESSQHLEDAVRSVKASIDYVHILPCKPVFAQTVLQRLVSVLANLSRSYLASSLLDEALELCLEAERLLRTMRDLSGDDVKGANFSSLSYVKAVIYQRMGENDRALQEYQFIAEHVSAHGSGGIHYVAAALQGIGLILFEGNYLREANMVLVRALTLWTNVLGGHHCDVAETLYVIGRVLHDKEEFADALEVYLRALAVQRQVNGADNLQTLRTLCNISRVQHAQGKLHDALATCHEVLKVARAELGHQHHFVAESLLTEARILGELGKRDCAVAVLLEATRIMNALEVDKTQEIIEEYSKCLRLERTPDAAAA